MWQPPIYQRFLLVSMIRLLNHVLYSIFVSLGWFVDLPWARGNVILSIVCLMFQLDWVAIAWYKIVSLLGDLSRWYCSIDIRRTQRLLDHIPIDPIGICLDLFIIYIFWRRDRHAQMLLFDVTVGVFDSPQILDIDIFIISRSQTIFKLV